MTDLQPEPALALWRDDTGTLVDASRRALVEILKGPYLSGRSHPRLWNAVLADEAAIRSVLHNLFLDLVIDLAEEVAFTRKVHAPEIAPPSVLRSESLKFIDTAMLLVLRQMLLAAHGERRVIVGQDEVFERLMVYRDGDETVFLRSLNAAWGRMQNKLRVLHTAGEGRVEISPVLRFIVDEDRVRSLEEVYARLVGGSRPSDIPDPDAMPESAEAATTGAATPDSAATQTDTVEPQP